MISSKGLSLAALNVIISIIMVLVLIGSLIMLGFAIIIVITAPLAAFGVQYNAVLVQFYSDVLAACMELMALILLPLCGIVITIWLAIESILWFCAEVGDARRHTAKLKIITEERVERLLAQCDCPVEVGVREDCDG